MNIRDLQAFSHLCHSLHFAQTAAAIHTSPSSLSRMIQRLESEFDQVLFERDNRQVRITVAGKRLLEFSEEVIAQWQLLKLDLDPVQKKLSGQLRIYCTVTAAHLYLPKIIERFRLRYPAVEIRLETGDVAAAYDKVEAGLADFAFAIATDKMALKFDFEHFNSVPFKVIAPKQTTHFSQFLSSRKIQWDKLPFVIPESGPALGHLQQWLQKMKLNPEIYAQVAGHEAIVSLIALGCGVSAVPAPVLALSPARSQVVELAAPFLPEPLELGVIALKRRARLPLIAVFWDLLKDAQQS